MVVAATGRACTATINAHIGVGLLSKGHAYTFHALVDADDGTPVGTHLSTHGWLCHRPGTRVGVVVAVRAIDIIHPRQTFHTQRLCRQILDAGGQTVIHIGEEVIALIPPHLRHI